MQASDSRFSRPPSTAAAPSGPLVCLHSCHHDEEAYALLAALNQAGVQASFLSPQQGEDEQNLVIDVVVPLPDLPQAGQVLRRCGYALPPPDSSPPPYPSRPPGAGSRLVPRRVSLWIIFVAIGVTLGFLDRLLPLLR